MKYYALILCCVLFAPVLPGVTIVECEDSDGERIFQNTCPPGTTRVGSRELQLGTAQGGQSAEAADGRSINATLYLVPDCGPCLDVQEYLQDRNISITTKDASRNFEIQNEIRELIGDLQVPVVIIGEKTLTGYNRSELGEALAAAGYREEKAEQ